MPKIRPLYLHNLAYGTFDKYVVERPGVEYRNHFVVLKNPGHGPHLFFCGHCGESHPAIRIAIDQVLEKVVSVPLDEDDFMGPTVEAHIPDKTLYQGNKDLVFAEFISKDDWERSKDQEEEVEYEDHVVDPDNPHLAVLRNVEYATSHKRRGSSFDARCENEVVAFKCGNCHKQVAAPEVQVIDQRCKEPVNHGLIWAQAKDISEDIVRFVWIVRTTTAWQDKLQMTAISHVISMNTRTGQSYLLPPHQDKQRAKWYKGPNLRTVTYHTSSGMTIDNSSDIMRMPTPILYELGDLLHKKIAARTPYPVKTIFEYLEEFLGEKIRVREMKQKKDGGPRHTIPEVNMRHNTPFSIAYFITYNRFPNLNPYTMIDVVEKAISRKRVKDSTETSAGTYHNKIDRRLSKVKNDSPDPIGSLLTAFGLPINKTYRAALRQNHKNLYALRAIMLNFKEVANVKKLLEANVYKSDHSLDWIDKHGDPTFNFGHTEGKIRISIRQFIDMMIAEQGETIVANKIAALRNMEYLKDAASTYGQIMTKTKGQAKLSLQGTIREIHDRFSLIYDTLAHPNIPIEYVDLEKSIEAEIGDYRIYLAKNTRELRTVGRMMGICVGSYGDRAVDKLLYIVLVIDMKNPDKYQACIEMDKRRKLIRQAKIRSNKLLHLKPELLELVTNWIKDNDLLVDTSDLPELKSEHHREVTLFRSIDYKPPWLDPEEEPLLLAGEPF